MEQYNYINKSNKIKDSQKGHKIAAALYLVSGHLSDTDPLKLALRTHAVTIGTATDEDIVAATSVTINALLGVATIAHLISEKNASIITLELRHYTTILAGESDTLSTLFTPVFDTAPALSFNSRPNPRAQSPTITAPKYSENTESKSKRQDTILSFIAERKSAGIKDIAALFSDTSEKTIQRELGSLVSSGKITKRGEKRWSVYMSVL